MISSQTNQVQYAGNGVTTAFSFPYLFIESDDLLVLLTDSDGVVTNQVLNTDYTVSGAGSESGGTVTFLTAPASGLTVTIINDPDLLQEIDYRDNDKFPAVITEQALDKLTIITQRLKERLNRSISLPDGFVGSFAVDIEGEPVANGGIKVKSDGTGLEFVDPDTLAFDTAAPTTTKGDIIVHDGTENVRRAVGANKTLIVADSSETTGLAYSLIGGSSTPAVGKVLHYDAASKTGGRWEYPAAGGGGSLQWIEGALAPISSQQSNFLCYEFPDALEHFLYTAIRVPSGHVAGQQIKLRMLMFASGTSNTILMQTLSTLIRVGTDVVSSTTNQRTSTNSAITQSGATQNIPQAIVFDLTDATGMINGVAVSGGDLILVRLTRNTTTDTATETAFVPVYGAEVTFNG